MKSQYKIFTYNKLESTQDIANLLISARRTANLSQIAIAQKMNVAPSNVARIESGRHHINFKTFQNYINSCGVTMKVEITE